MDELPDAGYTNLVALFQRKNDVLSTISNSTLTGSVLHYLTTIPVKFIPAFAQTIITSPSLWSDPAHFGERMEGFSAAFSSAIAVKSQKLKESTADGFLRQRRIRKELEPWLNSLYNGLALRESKTKIRLPLMLAMLQGIKNQADISLEGIQHRIEDELVVGCVELSEDISPESSNNLWVDSFTATTMKSENAASLRLLSQAVALIPDKKLVVLDLKVIADAAHNFFLQAVHEGHFLDDMDSSVGEDTSGRKLISHDSVLAARLGNIRSDPSFNALASISKLISRSFGYLVESQATRAEGWNTMEHIQLSLCQVTKSIQYSWARGGLADVKSEADIAPSTIPITTSIWTIFKTILFACVLIDQAILSSITFSHSPPGLASAGKLSSSVLELLLNTSSINSKITGGLIASGGGFTELKRTFFTALDILSASPTEANNAMLLLSHKLDESHTWNSASVKGSSIAFYLACAEQLMPGLTEGVVEEHVLPVATPLLTDPSNRETYESAHSVLLSIFASHSKAERESTKYQEAIPSEQDGEQASLKADLARRLSLFYLDCLLDNVQEGRLSTEQLCLAYSSLVSSATILDTAIAQLCIDRLLSALDNSTSTDLHHRLLSVLISLISSTTVQLLPGILSRIELEAMKESSSTRRNDLLTATFKEVSGNVADAEREVAMAWWMSFRNTLLSDLSTISTN